MGFTFIPSLKYLSYTRIGIALWSQENVKRLLFEYIVSLDTNMNMNKSQEWQALESEVVKNAQLLSVPAIFKQELLTFIQGVGWEIVAWFYFHKTIYDSTTGFPDTLYWTPHGGIDYRRTAEDLVTNENLTAIQRYSFSCLYCLEEHIYSLTEEIVSTDIYSTVLLSSSLERMLLVLFWSDHIEGKTWESKYLQYIDEELDSVTFPECGYQIATYSGNVEAMKFFLCRFSAEEQLRKLVETARVIVSSPTYDRVRRKRSLYADAICYLLSVMNDDQQMLLFEDHLDNVLSLLIEWPYQEIFVQLVDRCSGSFSHDDYYRLFKMIIGNSTPKGYNRLKLFKKYWVSVTVECKKHFVNKAMQNNLLIELLDFDDLQVIGLVLKETSAAQKKRMVLEFSDGDINIQLFCKGKWDEFGFFFILECLRGIDVTQEKIAKLKHLLKQFRSGLNYEPSPKAVNAKELWHNFFKQLDELIQPSE